jgi:DNA polymerase III epsilon subunit-like protein
MLGNNIIVRPPFRPTQILVFDVETTGLIPRHNKTSAPLSDYPYITQASFVMYDLSKKQITQTYDSYIKVPEHVVIGEEITNLTGITKKICDEKGCDITLFLETMYKAYSDSDVLVAHNFEFDETMILVELQRNYEHIRNTHPECLGLFNKSMENLRNVERYCTMKKGTDICNIMVESTIAGRPPRKKWPKLTELYVKLFDEPAPDGLHNSLVDVSATLKCYIKMRLGGTQGSP